MVIGGALTLGLIIWFISIYSHYSFANTEEARLCYLEEKASEAEQKAYRSLVPYFTRPPRSLDKSKRALDLANQFLEQYPASLFSVPADQINYVKVYKVPLGLGLFASNIPDTAAELAGSMLRRRAEYRETYQRRLREARHRAETLEIKQNTAESKFHDTKKQVFIELGEYVEQLEGEYRDKAEELSGMVDASREAFEAEKKRVHEKVSAQARKLKFAEALKILAEVYEDKSQYKESVAGPFSTFTAETPEEKAKPKIRDMKTLFIGLVRSMKTTELKELFQEFAEAKGLAAAVQTVHDQPRREKELFDQRRKWYEMLKTALAKARQYNNLVANTKTKHRGYRLEKQFKAYGLRLKGVRERPGDRIEVVKILRNEMQVLVSRYEGGKTAPARRPNIPLIEIARVDVFHELAARAWGHRPAQELKLLRGCHEFYLRPLIARRILRDLGEDELATFLFEEIAIVFADWTTQYLDDMLARIRNAKTIKERKLLYQRIKELVGDTAEFEQRENEIQNLVIGE